LQNAIEKTLIKSITYEHVLENAESILETCVRKVDFVACDTAFYLIMIVAHIPQSVAFTE
jgi:hypothetical protein